MASPLFHASSTYTSTPKHPSIHSLESNTMSFLLLLLLPLIFSLSIHADSDLHTYIIQVRTPPPAATPNSISGLEDLDQWYHSFLPDSPTPRMVHTYSHAITGFAALLTDAEAEAMSSKDGFLKAHPDRLLPLHTTHTPAFLGLRQGNGFWNISRYGAGVIIGVLDSGILASHPSFHDAGMPPPPTKWKGRCAANFTGCNNKIIGAKDLGLAPDGAMDDVDDAVGHGTHTASTAAGGFVRKASVLGVGKGTAAGMAPYAHLAVYKVCGFGGCRTADVMAGMDAAVSDGVDVLSLSLGREADNFYNDVVATGAFRAAEKGIVVVCAAGNSGPSLETVENEAPWILTVGASTMDRNIRVDVKLGDGRKIHGESAFQPRGAGVSAMPLVYPRKQGGVYRGNCYPGALDGINVMGKVVVCRRGADSRLTTGNVVRQAGGAAMIIMNLDADSYTTLAEVHSLPASHVSYSDGLKILSYINSNPNATASLEYKGTITGTSPAPTVASFSSRGPSKINPGILKPDIIAPGVNILAAWPYQVGPPPPTTEQKKTATTTFNIISGTSMATPHMSGIAALVKGEHPDWSPAAIKSAIMTTSDVLSQDGKRIKDERQKPASFFLTGAGHVNPCKAADPGLVYDIDASDYVAYLCGMGYTNEEVELVAGRMIDCGEEKKIYEAELNYPSISVGLGFEEAVVKRTVTNVGEARERYSAVVEMPEGVVTVAVSPETLEFSEVKEKKSFTVRIRWSSKKKNRRVEGNLVWASEKHAVRSPIVVS